MQKIPFIKPTIVKLEAYSKYIQQIDDSHIYSNFGPLNRTLESRIIDNIFHGDGYCATVSNCTSGLMLAMDAVRRKDAKYAVMPSFTFSATAQAALWCGLEPYFVDINSEDWSLDVGRLEEAIAKLGDEIAVVVPYATFANNMDLTAYKQAQRNGIPVVIDAAPGFGSRHNGHAFAKGFNGAVVYSFHATKGFCIGEGGLVYSARQDIIRTVRQASNFGFSGPCDSICLGMNAKLSEYAAAIGLASLKVFDAKIEARHKIYQDYCNRLDSTPLFNKGWQIQKVTGIIPFQFFSILLPEKGWVTKLSSYLADYGIASRRYFYPCCHQQPCFRHYPADPLTVTKDVSSRVIALPLWEGLHAEQIDYIVDTLEKFDGMSF